MNMLSKMKLKEPYVSNHLEMPHEFQTKAADLCWEYNTTHPNDREMKQRILSQLVGTMSTRSHIKSPFQCDYGFNIHMEGFAMINYNCVILDTSPVTIGNGVFIAPGVCLACSSHAIDATERAKGYGSSAPITLEEGVWIGANTTVLGGVTIGKNSIIGAGSVVNKSIPEGVIAAGTPCKVIRKVTEADRIHHTSEF